MRSTIALGIAAFAGLGVAQGVYPYSIDPESVSLSSRQYWCAQNKAQCPLICLQQPGVTSLTTSDNECDAEDLTYTCVCENGVSPNITQYSQTLPFFICQEWGNQCVKNCGGDNLCQNACRADHPCGAQSPYTGNASLSTSAASTQTPTGSATTSIPVNGFAGQTGTSSTGSGAAPGSFAPNAALGVFAVFGSIFLGFAVLL